MSRSMLGFLALCVACGAQRAAPAPSQLIADRGDVEFTTTSPGDSSDEVAVRITNGGAQVTPTLTTALVGAQPEAFAVVSDGCTGASLQPGSSCDLHVLFRPSSEQRFGAELRVSAGGPALTVALSGTGANGVRLSISAATHFGGVETGKSMTADLAVANTGPRASAPLSMRADGDRASFFLEDQCSSRSLASGQSCGIRVTFTPDSLGAKAISLAVTSGASSATARLDGYGKGVVTLTVTKEGDGIVSTSATSGRCADAPCSLAFEIGLRTDSATLVATPGPNSMFTGWSGDCSGTGTSCEVAMSARRAVMAKFAPAVRVSVEAAVVAGGYGTVGIDPGAACTAPCTASVVLRKGSRVRMIASAPNVLSQF